MPPIIVKICVLGCTGVGKTKLIKQFIYNYYDDDQYESTNLLAAINKDNIYNCTIMFNGNLYQLKIIDMPAIRKFPSNITNEWLLYQQCHLYNANAFIFCFDLNQPLTFNYIKSLRDQLYECRNMQNIPIWIVGTKADLSLNILAQMRSHHHHHHHHHHYHHLQHDHHQQHHAQHRFTTHQSHRSILHPTILSNQIYSPYEDIQPALKEFSNQIRKQWKCNYLECSAKYNWHIVTIFRELLKTIDPIMMAEVISSGQQQQHQPTTSNISSTIMASSAKDQSTTTNVAIIKLNNTPPSRTISPIGVGGGGDLLAATATTTTTSSRRHSQASNRICQIS